MSSSTESVPLVTLRDGAEIPQIGFGVFQIPPEDTAAVVDKALATGYRHIDTAAAYQNEAGVGQALRASGLERGDVFITTKCFNDDQGYDAATRALRASLDQLEMDYVDLYLIHWPVPSQDLYVETWKAFIEAQEHGLVRSIGVSNFQPAHLERLVQETIAEAHDRTPGQVVIRWHLQIGNVVIPKSVTPERTAQNFQVFDFELSDEEMSSIEELDAGERTGPDPDTFVRP